MRRNLATFVGKNGAMYFYAPRPPLDFGKGTPAGGNIACAGRPRRMDEFTVADSLPTPQDEPHVSVRNMNRGRA